MHRRTFILQPLLLSAVHTCHMINTHPARGAADVTLQCCHYNDSSKHCRRGNSRDEEELRSSAATHSTDGLCVCLSNTVSLRSLPVPVHASALRPVDGGGGCEELHPSGERGNMSERWGFSPLRPVIHGGGCWSAPGAHLWFGLLAGRPCNSCQQVTCPPGSQGGEEGSGWWWRGLTFLCPALDWISMFLGCKYRKDCRCFGSPTLLNFSSNVTIYLNMLSLPCFTIATNDKQTVRSARVNQLCPDSGAWSKCV